MATDRKLKIGMTVLSALVLIANIVLYKMYRWREAQTAQQSSTSSQSPAVVQNQGQETSPNQKSSLAPLGVVSKSNSGGPSGGTTPSSDTSGVSVPLGTQVPVGVTPGLPLVQSPVLNSLTPSAVSPQQQQEEPKISQGCFTLSLSHKKMESHADGEACSRHRNAFALKVPHQAEEALINPKSICVKVNGSPVKYEFNSAKKAHEILIGSEAGPDSKVTVRYCLGQSLCPEKCVVKEDAFLSAMGGDVSADDSKGEDDSKDLEREVVSLVKKIDELSADPDQPVFKDWIVEKETEVACQNSKTPKKATGPLRAQNLTVGERR